MKKIRKDIFIDNFINKLKKESIDHTPMISDLLLYSAVMIDVNLRILKKYIDYTLDVDNPKAILIGAIEEKNRVDFYYIDFKQNTLYCKCMRSFMFEKYKHEINNLVRLKKLKRLI